MEFRIRRNAVGVVKVESRVRGHFLPGWKTLNTSSTVVEAKEALEKVISEYLGKSLHDELVSIHIDTEECQ